MPSNTLVVMVMRLNNLEFSAKEIESVCKELGIPVEAFSDKDSERRKIIDHWDNANIIACPGSGKTTVLLAKLLLLSRRMPFDDGSGICVLTHTNVAIDEIKSKLGSKANILFKHPNFFGTIQGFVNKFLALPHYYNSIKVQNRSIKISEDLYKKKIDQESYWCLKNEAKDTFNKVKHIFCNNEKLKYNYRLHANNDNNKISLIKGINKSPLEITKPGSKKRQSNYIDYSDTEKELVNQYLQKLKFKILKDGVLHYDDLFFLANRYIKINNPTLITGKRFKCLFVDEMQDTQQHQMDILSVFNDNVVKQYYGDPDQAIFNGISGEEMAWNYIEDNFPKLEITDSKRYGTAISQCIYPFRKEISKVEGDPSKESFKPCLLLYGNPKDAIEIFHSEIQKRGLIEDDSFKKWNRESSPFNAVGFVGKKPENGKDKLTIHSYTDNFSKETTKRSMVFNNLVSYFQKRPSEEIEKEGTRIYYNLFLNAFLELLSQNDKKTTKQKLLKELSEIKESFLNEFNLNAYQWIKCIEFDAKSPSDIRDEFVSFLKNHKYEFNNESFVQDNDVLPQAEFKQNSNLFSKDSIDIKIGTIHSVKGETHMATLLLENQNDGKFESDYFFNEGSRNLFCGDEYSRSGSYKQLERRLKTAYVAMSRPTHLLCVAMRKERAKCTECPNEKRANCMWEIIE